MKPNFAVSSKQLADLFEYRFNYEKISKIGQYTIDDSRRGYHLLFGIIPAHMSLSDVCGCQISDIRANNSLESKLDMDELREQILKNFENNKIKARNTMSCTYFKLPTPPNRPLYFIQTCIPLDKRAIVVLNRRKGYLYVGKYHSDPREMEEYDIAVNKLIEEDRFLSPHAIMNMRVRAREIYHYFADLHQTKLDIE